jgi:hypothetical protein
VRLAALNVGASTLRAGSIAGIAHGAAGSIAAIGINAKSADTLAVYVAAYTIGQRAKSRNARLSRSAAVGAWPHAQATVALVATIAIRIR